MPQIPIGQIKLDQRAQPRSALNTDLTAEYAEAMKAGAVFPPLTVFHDGRVYWLADGFHRRYAAASIGARDIACVVKPGGLRDAILHSCQANAVHGLRRSDEDKRRAVKVLLADKEWSTWSDREIARRCVVSHTFVAGVRAHSVPLTGNVASEKPQKSAISSDRTYRTRHGTVATMDTGAIGSKSVTERGGEPSKETRSDGSRTARSDSSDAPQPHAAFAILVRSIAAVPGTALDLIASCPDSDALEELREACESAATRIVEIVELLSQRAAA